MKRENAGGPQTCSNHDAALLAASSTCAHFVHALTDRVAFALILLSAFVTYGCGINIRVFQTTPTAETATTSSASPDPCLSATTYSAHGSGTTADPYQICTAAQFADLGNNGSANWDKEFILKYDVDLADYDETTLSTIGNVTTQFTGVFDGNEKTISNFSYSEPSSDNIGLFGYVNGQTSVIKDFSLVNVDLQGRYRVGALAGMVYRGSIENVLVTGKVRGDTNTGGLVGWTETVDGGWTHTFRNLTAVVDVLASSDYAGGVIGYTRGNLRGYNLQVYGRISAPTAGGITSVGATNTGSYEIYRSFSDAVIVGSTEIGGIAGYNNAWNAVIQDSYSKSVLIPSSANTGGIFGRSEATNQTMKRTYFSGVIRTDGAGTNGVLIGTGLPPTLQNNVWTKTLNYGLTGYGAAADPAGIAGKTLGEMGLQQTYVARGWDFEGETGNGTNNYWKMPSNGGPPILSYQTDGFDWDIKTYNGKKIGYTDQSAFTVSGTCPTNGNTIMFDGDASGSATCSGGVFSATLDFSSINTATANAYVTIRAYESQDTNFPPYSIGRYFEKDTKDCDDADERTDAGNYANSTTNTSSGTYTQGVAPWVICTATQLDTLSANSADWVGAVLKDHIDMTGTNLDSTLGNAGTGWGGNFDGSHFEVRNWTDDFSGQTYCGFIGYMASGSIQNIGFVNVNLECAGQGGIALGHVNNGADGNWVDVYVIGRGGGASDPDISCTAARCGGLFGYQGDGFVSLRYFYSTADVVSTANSVGGIVGDCPWCDVTNSYNTGLVKGANYVGGAIGYSSTAAGGAVRNTYNTGSITASGDYAGGLNGYSVPVTNSYNTGSVSADQYSGGIVGYSSEGTYSGDFNSGSIFCTNTSTDNYAGGIAGWSRAATIENVVNTGSISGLGPYVGGIAGVLQHPSASSGTLRNSYSTGTVTGDSRDVGGLAGLASESGQDVFIYNSYSTGNITGDNDNSGDGDSTAGLIGNNAGDLFDSFTAAVVATEAAASVGPAIGKFSGAGSLSNSYYDSQTGSCTNDNVAGCNATGTTEPTSADLYDSATHPVYDYCTATGGGQCATNRFDWDFTTTGDWMEYDIDNDGTPDSYPILRE